MCSLPWNQDTPFGYFCEICLGIFWSEDYFIANGTLLLLFISMSWHHRAFYEIFQQSVQKAEEYVSDQQKLDAFCKIVCFHNSVKG